jgi:excisionase family DNA binding protein
MSIDKQKITYLNANDVCKLLKIGRSTFVKLCRDGLPRVRIGPKTIRYIAEEVEAWLRNRGTK